MQRFGCRFGGENVNDNWLGSGSGRRLPITPDEVGGSSPGAGEADGERRLKKHPAGVPPGEGRGELGGGVKNKTKKVTINQGGILSGRTGKDDRKENKENDIERWWDALTSDP